MQQSPKTWFEVVNKEEVDTPALMVYPDRVKENILLAIREAGGTEHLRPHVKTNKIAEVCTMMLAEGITRFKCATIAEAEMLGSIGAPDVLIAYPVVGPNVGRLLTLIDRFPHTSFSCLVDHIRSAEAISEQTVSAALRVHVFIDLNAGMNRTGIHIKDAFALYEKIILLPGITMRGLHAYDGHIRDVDIVVRQQRSDAVFAEVRQLADRIAERSGEQPLLVLGGSPTFPTHHGRAGVECSPGTFVFWDFGYHSTVPGQPFDYAALVATRVISVIDEHRICTDLGYKAISSESPLPRVFFLNAPDAKQISHSEEHLVLEVENASAYTPGDLLYGVPLHICPTVALYERAAVVEDHRVLRYWNVVARDRKITI